MTSIINFSTTPQPAHAAWRKSSRTGGGSGGGGNCVEVAAVGDLFGVRDSKNPTKNSLLFSPHQWDNLIREVKHGELDL
jgi:hypothetical protein